MNSLGRTIATSAIVGLAIVSSASVASAQPTALPPAIASIESQLSPHELERLQNLSPSEAEKFDAIGELSGPAFIQQIANFFRSIGLGQVADLILQIFGPSSPTPPDPEAPIELTEIEQLRLETEDTINTILRDYGLYGDDIYGTARETYRNLDKSTIGSSNRLFARTNLGWCWIVKLSNEEFTEKAPSIIAGVQRQADLLKDNVPHKNALAWAFDGDDEDTIQIDCGRG